MPLNGNAPGTTFIFKKCNYVLTNYHVAFGGRIYRKVFLEEENVDFSEDTLLKEIIIVKIGVTDDPNRFADEVEAKPVVWGDFWGTQGQDDWALLKTNRCLEGYKILPIANYSPQEIDAALARGARPGSMGYQTDKFLLEAHGKEARNQLYGDLGCFLEKYRGEFILRTKCSVGPGGSGSPFLLVENKRPRVIGLVSGPRINIDGIVPDEEYDDLTSNQIVPMYHIIPKIEAYFKEHPEEASPVAGEDAFETEPAK